MSNSEHSIGEKRCADNFFFTKRNIAGGWFYRQLAKQSWTLAATVAERWTRAQLWTTEIFYKRQPTEPSSRQNAVSRNNCRCCFWDFEREIPVRFRSTRTEKQATSDRERTIRLVPARAHCYRFQLVLLWYSTGETAPDGILVFVWFCWNRIRGQRGMVRRRAEWVSKLSSVNVFCFDSRACMISKWCSSEADVNVCFSD